MKRVGELWINVVVEGDAVKTAYLLNARSYRRLRERDDTEH